MNAKTLRRRLEKCRREQIRVVEHYNRRVIELRTEQENELKILFDNDAELVRQLNEVEESK